MLAMRDHDVEDYTDLHDMDGSEVGVLTDDDRACLTELGQYLATTDAWKRFGIWLLHKHFEPSDGEVFVEQLADWPRGTRTAPIERGAFTQSGLNATAIRFDGSIEAGVGAIGIRICRGQQTSATRLRSVEEGRSGPGRYRRTSSTRVASSTGSVCD